MGPMGFGGPPPMSGQRGDIPKEKIPSDIRKWPEFFLKKILGGMRRLLYIFGIVWETKPIILISMLVMALFNGISPVALAYISKLQIDYLIQAASGKLADFSYLAVTIAALVFFQFLILVFNSIGNMITRQANELVVTTVKVKIMNKAKTVDLSRFDLPEFYSKLENANLQASLRPLSVISSSCNVVSIIISTISFILVLAVDFSWIPIVLILISIPSAVINYRYRDKTFQYVRRRSKDRREMDYYGNLLVTKDLVKEVKMFGLADFFIKKYKKVFLKYFKGLKKLILGEGIWGISLSGVSSGVNCWIFIKIARRVFDGLITVGDFTLYSNAMFSILNNISSLVSTTAGIFEGTLYIDNLIDFMNEEPKIVPLLPVPRHVNHGEGHTIEFKSVSFSYPGTERKVIDNMSFVINPGDTVVLVGLNGAGKTTLLKLLTRLYDPTAGMILFDGHDIREYDVSELYSVFGMIFQDFGKYSFDVYENIGFGDEPRMDDKESIRNAAGKSGASEFIDNLPREYETPLTRVFDETGTELSIGQWQKIAIARAFFRKSDILILDEPTASLDPLAEQQIFRQFDELGAGKTAIFVSHRLSSATIANKIFVIEDGKIIEQGTHSELMRLGGKYENLFSTQAKRYIENRVKERQGLANEEK